ncbi:MAG TPA: DUF2877 domain-containing protein [Anaerolineales bacterium]|nr:DUF2877 domain-containing protein [Anaerolineales bacterium]
MQIRAASIGEAVPAESFDAVIHSAFESAVNMRLMSEDRLITLLISDRYKLPQGIHVTQKDTPLQALEPGRLAACRGGILRFDTFPLSIDLRGAPVWKCGVAGLMMEMDLPSAQQAWSTAWDVLNRRQRRTNCDIIADDVFRLQAGSVLGQRISRPVLQLVASADAFDAGHSIQAAETMIGLGPGVTPSGDDILIGFLAGLWSLSGEHPKRHSFIRSFGEGVLQIAQRTNEISRTYLVHAARGQFSSALSALVENIGTGGDVEQAAQDAMRVGHSSGMDTVTGLLAGLAVWNAPTHPYPIHLHEGKPNSGKSYGHIATSD